MAKNAKQDLFDAEKHTAAKGPVECLGMKFPNDAARRAYFLEKLREKLKDPAFRKIEGFPLGEDDDILAMSDPPYYTACPNPFVDAFVKASARNDSSQSVYHREPFSTDVSEGKTDGLYTAHAYHTKVPHKAIMRYMLHYTEPGDIVLDGFCGSGMTGVAAQMCGCPDAEFRSQLESERRATDYSPPKWGYRNAILCDLSPVATFISSNYNLPIDLHTFEKEAKRLLASLREDIGWMYKTAHGGKKDVGAINFTVWSEVFRCQECGGEVVFLKEGFDEQEKKVRDSFPCPHCNTTLTKRSMERIADFVFDSSLGKVVTLPKRKPLLINYSVGGSKAEKPLDQGDFQLLERAAGNGSAKWFPTDRMMHVEEDVQSWGDNWRSGTANFTHIHHIYLPRSRQALAALWEKANSSENPRVRSFLKYFVEQAIWGLSVLARYAPSHFSQVNQYMSGLIRILSQHSECSPWYILEGKLSRLVRDYARCRWTGKDVCISTNSCSLLPMSDNTIDYIFTDPPFGDNLAYAELNFLIEAWHRVFTNPRPEAIMSDHQRKGLLEYQDLMRKCFKEYWRVLKPGRWMTVVFHNSKNSVWNAIQEAIRSAGFVIADVRTMDKKQGSDTVGQPLGAAIWVSNMPALKAKNWGNFPKKKYS